MFILFSSIIVSISRGYLYQFMNERYHEDEISTVASYDLINGIVKFAEKDKVTCYCQSLSLKYTSATGLGVATMP